MGFGNGQARKKIYYCSPRGSSQEGSSKVLDPHFIVTMTDENGVKHKVDKQTSVFGFLVELGHGKYEYPKGSNEWNNTVKIKLYDPDEDALIQIEANVQANIIRSLMNTVIGTQTFEEMRISLYPDKEAKWPNIYVSDKLQMGKASERVKRKYDYKTQLAPLVKEVENPQKRGQMIKVYHAVDDLLWEEWLKVELIANDAAKKTKWYDMANAAPKARPAATQQHMANETFDDLNSLRESDLDQGNQGSYVPDFQPGDSPGADDLPF